MDSKKVISVLETTRLMFEMSLPLSDDDCDKDTIEAREDNEETIEAITEAIKAVKRGDVLDKIRAEITEERKVENIPEDVEMWDYIRALDRTLSIIGKYKAESEEA